MGIWFWPRTVDHTARALDFLNGLRHDAMVYPWVIGRRRGNHLDDAATLLPGKMAHDWIAARAAKQQLYCLTGEVAGAPRGGVSSAHVLSTRLVAVSIPKPRIEQALAFRPAPSILVETERDYAAAWRLHNPVEAYVAGLLAKAVAEALGGVPLPFILPLPGSAGVGRHQYLKGPSNWTLQTDLIRRAPQPAAPAAEPAKAPAAVPPVGASGHAGRWQGRGRSVLGAVREHGRAAEQQRARNRRSGLGQNADAQRADRRRGRDGPADLHLRLQERLFGARLRAGHRAEGLRYAPAGPALQSAHALVQRGGPGPAHRAHFHHRGRAEPRIRPRPPSACHFARRHEGGVRAARRRSASVGARERLPGAKLRGCGGHSRSP